MSVQPGEVVLSFSSHRARQRSGVHGDSRCTPVYSFHRASHGGYYKMSRETADEKLIDGWQLDINGTRHPIKAKGVSVLRAPYDDILNCWSGT